MPDQSAIDPYLVLLLSSLAITVSVGGYISTTRLTLIGWALDPHKLEERKAKVKSQAKKMEHIIACVFGIVFFTMLALAAHAFVWPGKVFLDLTIVAGWMLMGLFFFKLHRDASTHHGPSGRRSQDEKPTQEEIMVQLTKSLNNSTNILKQVSDQLKNLECAIKASSKSKG